MMVVSDNAVRPAEGRMENRARFWWNMLLRIGAVVFLGYFVWRTREIITTLTISLILASIADAMVNPICRKRWGNIKPHMQRTIATLAAFVVLFGTTIVSVIYLVQPFRMEYQNLQKNWPEYRKRLDENITKVQVWYDALPPNVRAMVGEKGNATPAEPMPSPGEIVLRLLKTTVSWASHAFELLLIPILAFYLVVDSKRLRNEMVFLIPPLRRRTTLTLLRQATRIMRSYIVAQCFLAVIAGIVIAVLLSAMGMKYPVILGLFAGLTRAIPVVGGFLGTVPVVLLAFAYGAQTGQPTLWLQIFVIISLINVLESKWLMPKLLGHHLDLHPVLIIVALLIGGEFFGLMGMFLAAPVAAFGRVLLVNYFIRSRRNALAIANNEESTITTSGGDILRLDRAFRMRRENLTTPKEN